MKQDIENKKQDIGTINPLKNRTLNISEKSKKNIQILKSRIGFEQIFGRRDVMEILGITASPASALIKKMLEERVIQPQKGYGKGRYIFK